MKINLTILFLLAASFAFAQKKDSKKEVYALEKDYDLLVVAWEKLSVDLKTYSGLQTYCKSDEYKKSTINILEQIHHYDTLILEVMSSTEALAKLDEKEKASTLKEIEKFESEYSVLAFIAKLTAECKYSREIEKDKKYSKSDIGANSYDGQILLLETDLSKFIKHIDSRVEHIDDHIHKLHIDNVRTFKSVN
jgi:hypothetical protein